MNPFDLTGHVAIVTGGNGGLGLAMARGLARAGASIALAARDESKGQAAVKELIASAPRTRFYAFQASSASSCRKLIETVVGDFGSCDILINNAGMIRRKPREDPQYRLDVFAVRRADCRSLCREQGRLGAAHAIARLRMGT